MSSASIKVDLYGTRNRRLRASQFSKAKAFHVFVKKKAKGKFARLTDSLIVIPKEFTNAEEKRLFIDFVIDELKQQLGLAGKNEIKDFKEKPIQITKKQFKSQVRRIVYDVLVGRADRKEWPESRIEGLIEKLWKALGPQGRSHATDEEFRRKLVSLAIHTDSGEIKKKGERPGTKDQEAYAQALSKKDKISRTDTPLDLTVQFKEVFSMLDFNKRNADKEFYEVYEKTKSAIVEKPRQLFFSQVIGRYHDMIKLRYDRIRGSQDYTNEILNKVKDDIIDVFKEASEVGLFEKGKRDTYSIRIISPMYDINGDVQKEYLDREGNKTSGHGFSIGRFDYNSLRDVEDHIDDLFKIFNNAQQRYLAVNSMAGVAVDGFVVERTIQG